MNNDNYDIQKIIAMICFGFCIHTVVKASSSSQQVLASESSVNKKILIDAKLHEKEEKAHKII
jgi:hypothetical protein